MKMPKRPEIKNATYREETPAMRVVHTQTWAPIQGDKWGFKFNLMLTHDGKYHVDVLPLNPTSEPTGIALNAYDEPFRDIDLALAAIDQFIEAGLPYYLGA